MYDMTRIEVVDVDSDTVEWSGPVDEFEAANLDEPLSEEERDHLARHGYVVVGGGAAAAYCVRYALLNSCGDCGATREEIVTTGHRQGDARSGLASVPCREACTCVPEHFSMAEHTALVEA